MAPLDKPADPKLIQSLPPEVLKLLPGEQPPPGVTPNFSNPASLVPTVVGVGTASLALALFCFSIRIYTNMKITKRWRWDDLTCTLGFIFAIIYYAFVLLGDIRGSGGKHLYEVHLDRHLNLESLLQGYVATVIATPTLGLIKGSLFIQYYIVFKSVRYIRISVCIGATLLAILYVVVTIIAFILNSPWPGETLLEALLSPRYKIFQKLSIPTGVIGMAVDWFLFFLPIPAVYNLHLSSAKKFGVMLVFMTGGLAAIGSTMALYYRIQLHQDNRDAQWKASYIFIWGQIEMFGGVAAASMPSVKRLFTHKNSYSSKWNSSIKSSLTKGLYSSTRNKTRREGNNNNMDGQDYDGAYRSTDFAELKKPTGLTTTALGNSQIHLDSHILLTRDVIVTEDRAEDVTLSRW